MRILRVAIPVFLMFVLLIPFSTTIAQDNNSLRQEGELSRPVAYWVYLDRRDTSEEAYEACLSELDPKAIQRRIRARGTAVNESDLPFHPDDLAAIRANGFHIRTISRWLGAVSVIPENETATLENLQSLAHVREIRQVGTYQSINDLPDATPSDYLEPDNNGQATPRSVNPQRSTSEDSAYYGFAWAQNQLIGVPEAHEMGYTGEGVRIGFLDGGYNFYDVHPAFANLTVVDTWNAHDSTSNVFTGTHGSACLSVTAANLPQTMVGVAPNVEVLLVRTEDGADEYPEEEDYFVAGLEWAETNGADLISTSLGYSDWYSFDDYDGNTCLTTVACDEAAARGLLVITSAGNRGEEGLSAPADGDSVLAVAAVDSTGEIRGFSSRGPTADGRIKPDVSAMGYRCAVVPDSADGYRLGSGTSFSCPAVAGAAALMLESDPTLLPMDFINILRATADRSVVPDNAYGWGIINIPLALNELVSPDHNSPDPVPYTHSLGAPYPNPFNPSVQVPLTLLTRERIVAQVYDVLGRKITTLHDGSLAPGIHMVTWVPSEIASGAYILRVQFGEQESLSRRLLYVK